MQTQLALWYAVIRYMPYLETREFATVGVVAACPKTGYFDYKLTSRYGRFSRFFPEFDAQVYRAAIAYFAQELQQVKDLLRQHDVDSDGVRNIFEQLTRDREAIVCTSKPGVRLVTSEVQGLDDLFEHYVNHNFVNESSAQAKLTQRVVNLVRGFDLPQPFKEAQIGGHLFHATFPLVQLDGADNPVKIIKPLCLSHSEPNKIYEGADLWIGRVERFKETAQMPASTAILFAYDKPAQMTGPQSEALQMVQERIERLNRLGIMSTEACNEGQIKKFAFS